MMGVKNMELIKGRTYRAKADGTNIEKGKKYIVLSIFVDYVWGRYAYLLQRDNRTFHAAHEDEWGKLIKTRAKLVKPHEI